MRRQKRILVRAPNWIGDQVLAYPFFYQLRRQFADAHIAVACVSWVKELQFRQCVDEVIVLQKPRSARLNHKLLALNESAKLLRLMQPWDLAISLPNSLSAAALLWRAGAKVRRGYAHEGRGVFLNDSLDWTRTGAKVHRAQAYLDLLPVGTGPRADAKAFFSEPPTQALDPPKKGILGEFSFKSEWPEYESLAVPTEPYWVMAPGATAQSRRWPIEYFVLLAETIVKKTGWKGLVIGGPAEASLAASLVARVEGLEDWTMLGAVPRLAQLFRSAKFSVTNESGLAHVAALCGSFVQIICGAADPRRTVPIGPGRVQVAVNPVECWPCERNHCLQPPENVIRCLRGISPETVWGEIERGLTIEGRLK